MSSYGKWKANEKVKPQSPPAPEDYVGVPSTSSSYVPKGPIGRHQLPPEDNIPPPIVNVNVSTSSSTTAMMTRPFTGPHVVTSLHSTIPRSASSATSRSMAPVTAVRRTPTIVNVKPTGMCTSSPSPPISVTVPAAMVPSKSGVINGGNGPIIGVTTVPKSPVRAQSFAAQPNTPFTCFPTPVPSGDSSPTTRDRIFSRSQSASENNHSTLHRVLDYLYFGSFENAANTRWLCANRIAYMVNLTGTPRIKARGCNCGETDKYHKQFECTPKKIEPATKTEIIVQEFKKCNEFIAEARTNGFRVLVFNEDGEDLCQAVVVQHMMTYFKIPLAHAINQTTRNSDVRIRVSEPYMAALRSMEQEMEAASKAPSANTSVSGVTNMLHTFSFREDL